MSEPKRPRPDNFEPAEPDPGPGWLRARFMGVKWPRLGHEAACGRPSCPVCAAQAAEKFECAPIKSDQPEQALDAPTVREGAESRTGELTDGGDIEDAVVIRVNGVEHQIEIVWEAIESRPWGWRIHLICKRCGAWRHALFWHQGEWACRCCHGLRYICRTRLNRLPLRVARIRRRLGAEPSLLAPLPRSAWRRPKLVAELMAAEASLARQLHDTVARVRRRAKR